MSTRHSLPSDTQARPVIARTIRWLSVPIILGWLAVAVVVNVVAPQLEEVGAAHSVAMTAKDAPSTIGMMRIGKDFQQFDSDTKQRFVFPCLADINRPSRSASQVSTTFGSTQRQQSPNELAVDAMSIDQLSLRISRRREVGVKPETTSVRGSCATRGRGCFRCRSIKSSTSSRVMRQVRPTRYPDNSPRFKRRDSQRTPSAISGGRTIFATSESEYVLISSASSSITHTLTCVCAL
jgi:hypothetical protein